MKSKLRIVLLGALLTSTFALTFVGCKKDEEDSIVGKWYLYKEVETETDQEGTYIDEWVYNKDADYDYYGAQLFEITKNSIIRYENNYDGTYYEEEVTYVISGSTITITDGEGEYAEEFSMKFKIDNGTLIFTESGEDEEEGESWEYKMYFKKYSGSIPPASWIEPIQADSYEPDNTYEEANTIPVGQTTNAHTITPADEDWFAFSATEGERYLIQVNGYFDGYLEMYSTDGTTQIDSDDDNNDDIDVEVTYWGNPVLLWDCPTSGTYFFMVRGYGSDDVGYYSVSLSTSNLEFPYLKSTQVDKKSLKRGSKLFR